MNKQRVLKTVLPSAVVVGLTLIAGAVVVVSGAGASDAGASTSQIGAAESAQTESYWTPERMAAATPLDGRTPSKNMARMSTRSSLPTAHQFNGIPTVGTLFFRYGSRSHYCTASAIDSSKRNLIITAAHCIYGGGGPHTDIAYVPGYNAGSRPYGLWTVKQVTVSSGWKQRRDQDLDFGFVALNNQGGRRLADVTGNNVLSVNNGYSNHVSVAGYPMVKYARSDHPIWCNNTTHEKMRWQVEFDCAGFYGGTSGSPFLMHYSSRTHSGKVTGVLGGYQQGGNVDYISYASYFDNDVWNLRAAADRSA